MSKSDEYRANAAECQRTGNLSRNAADKQTWLEMAASWLRMIPESERTPSEKFDDEAHAQGTHQAESGSEH
jgi:hypothetical protein